MEAAQIIWDFDGVIIFSDSVRVKGFEVIFRDYEPRLVNQLLEFHQQNGGLSRYVKIRYFFESVLNESISDEMVLKLAQEFSDVMRVELTNKSLVNSNWLDFMNTTGSNYKHHIASGSDGEELRYLCAELGIDHFFESINGSPTPKKELVAQILKKDKSLVNETVLIGDAINDYEAATSNGIEFYGYNNDQLAQLGKGYLKSFDPMDIAFT